MLHEYDYIKVPLITEKSTALGEQNKYIFKVDTSSTKQEIKKIISKIFNVEVVSVNTINISGKTTRFRGIKGKRSNYKKAIVTIKAGQTIDLSAGVN